MLVNNPYPFFLPLCLFLIVMGHEALTFSCSTMHLSKGGKTSGGISSHIQNLSNHRESCSLNLTRIFFLNIHNCLNVNGLLEIKINLGLKIARPPGSCKSFLTYEIPFRDFLYLYLLTPNWNMYNMYNQSLLTITVQLFLPKCPIPML